MRGTAIAVALVMAALYAVDRSLARLETREVEAEAQDFFAGGQKLLAAGHPGEAAGSFQRAHSLDRTNRSFELALAQAQLAAGKPDEAQKTLAEPLDRDSNDGFANLLMARVLIAAKRFDDSVSYYHRAIYGTWPKGAAPGSTGAQLELAGHLAARGRDRELLSEVLLLDHEAQTDPALSQKVAAMYLEAGSAARAATAYRALIRRNPEEAEAHEGLGHAELQLGNYRAAHSAFTAAMNEALGNPKAAALVQLADNLANLDPTSRRLSSAEKFRRSQQILYLTEDAALDCLKGHTAPDALHDLLAAAGGLRSEKTPAHPSNEAAEARLELASRIWKGRLEACSAPPSPDDALTIIQKKMEQ